jgi:hypothetical protein
MHSASQSKRHETKAAELRVKTMLAKKAAAHQTLAQERLAKQVTSNIEAFEANIATSRADLTEEAVVDGKQLDRMEHYTAEKERMKAEAQVSDTG